MLHAHTIDIKNNTFFQNMHSLLRVFIELHYKRVSDERAMVAQRKPKVSLIL